MTDLGTFTNAYIEALYFTGDDIETAELSPEAEADILADCKAFWTEAAAIVAAATCRRGEYPKAAQAGHDFWMTRNRHGVGFWDGDWSEPQATRLDEMAKAYGETDADLGDDGKVYLT